MAAAAAAEEAPLPDEDPDAVPMDPWAGAQLPEVPGSPQDAQEYRQFLRYLNQERGRTPRRDREDDGDDGGGRSNAGPPPTWDGESPFKDYKIRARLWLATTKVKPKSRGPMLLRSRTGTPFDDLKYLAQDDAWMESAENGNQLLRLMSSKELYGEDEREEMLNSLVKVTYTLRRYRREQTKCTCMRHSPPISPKAVTLGLSLPKSLLICILVGTALEIISRATSDSPLDCPWVSSLGEFSICVRVPSCANEFFTSAAEAASGPPLLEELRGPAPCFFLAGVTLVSEAGNPRFLGFDFDILT